MRIQLPEKVRWIIGRLEEAGYEAYAVGGCVRDTILGRTPEDWDIATQASPMEVKALFRRTVDTGIRHGTVTVMLKEEGFEITTYRLDGKYEDARHPSEVTFIPSLEEDLKRRDFTINAMAYNDKTGLIDLFGGIKDIREGIIRCVGDARRRFSEDALRMMRAIRFSAQLGYGIEESTKNAISELAGNLKKISAERLQAELTKLVTSAHPEKLLIAYETGVLKEILWELQLAMQTAQNHPHHCYSVGEHILHVMQNVENTKELRLAAMLHDIGKPECLTVDEKGITHFYGHAKISAGMAADILRRFKYDNHTIETVRKLVYYHNYGKGAIPDRKVVRHAMNEIGEDLFPSLFELKRADILGQSDFGREEKLKNLEEWERAYGEILAGHECTSLKTLAITGNDLIAMGMKPGKELGKTLNSLLELVLDHPECNKKEILRKLAGENIR